MILVTGGCRSGKSEYGEQLAESMGDKKLYIATAEIYDEEMAQRVEKHRQRRGDRWDLHEGCDHLETLDYRGYDSILLDSITSIVTNLLFRFAGDADPDQIDFDAAQVYILDYMEHLITLASEQKLPLICVTDETGLGIVPETVLGRGFRDILGKVNQVLAAEASKVYFVVSGIPVCIKDV